MSAGPQIDWDKVSTSTAPSIDWDKVPSQGGDPYPEVGIHPKGDVQIGPRSGTGFEQWLEDVQSDVRHGTDLTLPGKALKLIGAEGTEKGAGGGPGGVGEMMGGELIGPAQVTHGMSVLSRPRTSQTARIRAGNDMLEGAFKSAGPGAALIPGAVPGAAIYGSLGAGARKVASTFGADDDTSELIGNLTSAVAPFSHPAVAKTGEFLQDHAPAIGKAAGYGTAAAGLIKTHNPLDLLLASKPVTKAAEIGTNLLGKGVQAAGETPVTPLVKTPPGEVIPTTDQQNDRFARNTMGMKSGYSSNKPLIPQLERGALVTPESVPEEGTPQLVNAQKQVIRGKGGRMTTQFTGGESTGGTQINPGPAWRGPASSVSPLVNSGEAFPEGEVLPPETQSQPLTNEPQKSIINTGDSSSMPSKSEELSPLVDTSMSRRNFLKLGGKVAAATAIPGGIAKPFIDAATDNDENNFGGYKSEADRKQFSQVDPVSLKPTMLKHLSEALNNFHHEGDGVDGIKPEDFESTHINSVTKSGSNFIVHMDAELEPGDASELVGLVSPEGKILKLAHTSDWNESYLIAKNGVTLPTDFDSSADPADQKFLGNSNDLSDLKRERESKWPEKELERSVSGQDSETPKDLVDIKDDKERNAEAQQNFDNDQAASDELSRKAMYKGMKKGYNPSIPGEHGEGPLLPWAQTPWGDVGIGDVEPQEGASASLKQKPLVQEFRNPAGGGSNKDQIIEAAKKNYKFGKGDVHVLNQELHGLDGPTGEFTYSPVYPNTPSKPGQERYVVDKKLNIKDISDGGVEKPKEPESAVTGKSEEVKISGEIPITKTTLDKDHILYHGTTPKRASNIISSGFKSSTGQIDDDLYTDEGRKLLNGVWLASKPDASSYARGGMIGVRVPKGTEVYSAPDIDPVGFLLKNPEKYESFDASGDVDKTQEKAIYSRGSASLKPPKGSSRNKTDLSGIQ